MISMAVSFALTVVTATASDEPLRRPTLERGFELMRGEGGATDLALLEDGDRAWAERWRALSAATKSIDASYFIVENDAFGLAFIAHLYMRARDGVKVRLLLDGRGSAPFAFPFLGLDEVQELVATGNASVHIYNPPVLRLPETVLTLSAVPVSAGTHGKILVVDDKIGITGGRNIGARYFADTVESGQSIGDVDVLLTGRRTVRALTTVMTREFSKWAKEGVRADLFNFDHRDTALRLVYYAMDAWVRGEVPDLPTEEAVFRLEAAALKHFPSLPPQSYREALRHYLRQIASARSIRGALAEAEIDLVPTLGRVVPSWGRAEKIDDTANDAIVLAISHARDRVLIQSPYFIMTPRYLAALTRASARGVKIVVVTNGPSSTDNDISQALFIDSWPELCARMPTLRVFASAKQMLHTKRVVVDDTLTLLGSHNLDPMSSHVNSEVVLAVWSRTINEMSAERIVKLIGSDSVREYRILRKDGGIAARDDQGRVLVAFGPAHHVEKGRVESLRSLKEFLFTIRGIWDFDFAVW